VVRQGLLENLTPVATEWVEEHLQQLLREQNVSQHPSIQNLARVVLTLAAQGEAVLIGRGAGFILPRASTLHVRAFQPYALPFLSLAVLNMILWRTWMLRAIAIPFAQLCPGRLGIFEG